MTQILSFPSKLAYAPVRIRSGSKHDVSVRILDKMRPEEAPWHLQFVMQRAASFRCLKDFTDKAASRGTWHDFKVRKTFRIKRFLRDIETLVREGRIAIEGDGVRVRSSVRKRA